MKQIFFLTLVSCAYVFHTSALADEASERDHLVAIMQAFFDAVTDRDTSRMNSLLTPYDLYVDGVFSHRGIDNFSFLKTDDGWKITGIVFSMETEDKPRSPLGPLQE